MGNEFSSTTCCSAMGSTLWNRIQMIGLVAKSTIINHNINVVNNVNDDSNYHNDVWVLTLEEFSKCCSDTYSKYSYSCNNTVSSTTAGTRFDDDGDTCSNTNTNNSSIANASSILEKEDEEQQRQEIAAMYEKAVQYYEQVLAMDATDDDSKNNDDHDERANCYERLGCLHARHGHLAAALESFEQALALKRNKKRNSRHEKTSRSNNSSSSLSSSSSVAKTLSNMASVYNGMGEHKKALTILHECLAIREKKEPRDSLKLAMTLGNMAVVYSHLEQYTEAIACHERAFEIKKYKDPGSISMATTCIHLANLCTRTDPPKAAFFLQRAKLIAETNRPVPYEVLSDVFTVTGHILRHADLFDDAIVMYHKAIQLESSVRKDSAKIAVLQDEIKSTKADQESTANAIAIDTGVSIAQTNNKDATKYSSSSSTNSKKSQTFNGITEMAHTLRTLDLHPDLPPAAVAQTTTCNIPVTLATPICGAGGYDFERVASLSSLPSITDSSRNIANTGGFGGPQVLPYHPSFDPPLVSDDNAAEEDTNIVPHDKSWSQPSSSRFDVHTHHSLHPQPHSLQRALSLTSLPEDEVLEGRDPSSPDAAAAVLVESRQTNDSNNNNNNNDTPTKPVPVPTIGTGFDLLDYLVTSIDASNSMLEVDKVGVPSPTAAHGARQQEQQQHYGVTSVIVEMMQHKSLPSLRKSRIKVKRAQSMPHSGRPQGLMHGPPPAPSPPLLPRFHAPVEPYPRGNVCPAPAMHSHTMPSRDDLSLHPAIAQCHQAKRDGVPIDHHFHTMQDNLPPPPPPLPLHQSNSFAHAARKFTPMAKTNSFQGVQRVNSIVEKGDEPVIETLLKSPQRHENPRSRSQEKEAKDRFSVTRRFVPGKPIRFEV